jgi:hypothetical protein
MKSLPMKHGWMLVVACACALVAAALPVRAAESPRHADTVKTLDAINIEGKIVVPQVLFITSHDQPRYRDGLALRFRPGALDVARSPRMPIRLRVVARAEIPKEETR